MSAIPTDLPAQIDVPQLAEDISKLPSWILYAESAKTPNYEALLTEELRKVDSGRSLYTNKTESECGSNSASGSLGMCCGCSTFPCRPWGYCVQMGVGAVHSACRGLLG